MRAIPLIGMKSVPGKLKLIFEVCNHDHFDRMVLGEIVADAHTDFAALTAIHRNECRFCCVIVENRVCFRAKLGTETASCLTAYGLIDVCN